MSNSSRVEMEALPIVLGGADVTPPRELVVANVAYVLGGEIQDLVTEVGTYQAALFGEARASKPPEGQGAIDQKRVLEDLGVFEPCYFPHKAGPAFDFRTTRGYNARAQAPGVQGYKFYFSADLSTPENLAAATEFYRELTSRALDVDIAFASKYWTGHLYDAWLIYTVGLPETAKTAEIIQATYPMYAGEGLFANTPHIFQGSVEGVDPSHVGWVREDLPGMPGFERGLRRSHSRRLQALGHEIDTLDTNDTDVTQHIEAVEANLTPKNFAAAALVASMCPDRPYLTIVPDEI